MHLPHSRRIATLLTFIVAGCIPKSEGTDATTGESVDTCTSSCCGFVPEHGTDEVSIPADAYAKVDEKDGSLSEAACLQLCQEYDEAYYIYESCSVQSVGKDGVALLACGWSTMCEGRPALGVRRPRVRGPTARSRWLARAAWAERASVPSFARLARELAAHDAPPELIQAARAAVAEEADHARVMTALARGAGATPPRPAPSPMHVRPLVELAVENAVTGCVGETWAAAAALHQASVAEDPSIRSAMAAIAADEVGHAELAWAVDAWLRTRLTAPEQARVNDARAAAVQRLPRVRYPKDPGLGLPDAATARRMRAGLAALFA